MDPPVPALSRLSARPPREFPRCPSRCKFLQVLISWHSSLAHSFPCTALAVHSRIRSRKFPVGWNRLNHHSKRSDPHIIRGSQGVKVAMGLRRSCRLSDRNQSLNFAREGRLLPRSFQPRSNRRSPRQQRQRPQFPKFCRPLAVSVNSRRQNRNKPHPRRPRRQPIIHIVAHV